MKLQKRGRKQSGFTLIELLIATVVLMVGIVAVAQLVPASIRLNKANRSDSAALVFAQRELNQFMEQPLDRFTGFTDALGKPCTLGDPASPNTIVGSPLVPNQPVIDFTAATVAGYSFTYKDPNDPYNATYDVRWAVVTTMSGTAPNTKRFLLGVRLLGGNAPLQAVTLDTMVSR